MALMALVSWHAVAGVNPHITEVDLDIDGVSDSSEFGTTTDPGGPGGFVASNGWKKITLSYTGTPALRVRLNWSGTKIGVYTDTTGTTAISNPIVWDIENGDTMPTNLWVKGLDVSANGPTTTTCGPEHMCLEAINNGTDYSTPLYDRVGFTVVAVDKIEYCRKDLDSTVAANWVTDTNVAAGAKDTDVHKAKIRVTIKPVAAGVSMVVTNSGGIGDAIACTLLPLASQLTDANGQVFCDYKSSDKVEGMNAVVTSLADWNMLIDLDSTLSNKWDCAGNYDWKVPETYITDVSDEVRFYPTLHESGGVGRIDTHDIHHFAQWVHMLVIELDYTTWAITTSEVEGTYPDYWYNDTSLPSWLSATTVGTFVEITGETEESLGVYKSTHTVHDMLHEDDAEDTLTLVITDAYKIGAYDMDVYFVP
jgi:hypothetical protein